MNDLHLYNLEQIQDILLANLQSFVLPGLFVFFWLSNDL